MNLYGDNFSFNEVKNTSPKNEQNMASATSPTYQTITIIALLVAAGILIFMAIVYTQNQNKWAIIDAVKKALKGPVSQLGITQTTKAGLPSTLTSVGTAASVRTLDDKDQFLLQTFIDKIPYFVIRTPAGGWWVDLSRPSIKL